jgi:hypothetical protein
MNHTQSTPTLPSYTGAPSITTGVKTSRRQSTAERAFYSVASITLLILTVIGFRFFYLHGQAFPGRELTPPIRALLITHGMLMTSWMLLAVLQPVLIAGGNRRTHILIGRVASVLALGIFVLGLRVAIQATRVNPPDLKLFGLAPKEFLVVPLTGIIMFAVFVAIGVWHRRRPEVHRPMMFMASLAVVAAAMGRMPRLNDWYAGTWLEYCFSAFLTTLILGAVLLVAKCAISKSFDRWFATAFGALTLVSVAMSLIARTDVWRHFATILLG